MKSFRILLAIAAGVVCCSLSVLAADEDAETAEEDTSAGLPEQYAKDYLIAGSTISPDKKLAVIYPTLEAEEAAGAAATGLDVVDDEQRAVLPRDARDLP